MLRPWQIPTLALKPWRLVRELDAYCDADCRKFMRPIATWRVTALVFAIPIALAAGFVLKLGTEAAATEFTVRGDWTIDGITALERASGMAYASIVLAGGATAAFIPYAVILRWIIRRRLDSLACPRCRYSLVGLPVTDAAVICPECGCSTQLKEYGWAKGDIIAGKRETPHAVQSSHIPMLERTLTLAIPAVILIAWIMTGILSLLQLFAAAFVLAALETVRWNAPKP